MKKYPAPNTVIQEPAKEHAQESAHLADLTGAVLSVVRAQYATQDRLENLIMELQPGKSVRVEIIRDDFTREMNELIITRE